MYLDKIIEAKKIRLEKQKSEISPDLMKKLALENKEESRDFFNAIKKDKMSLIAEIKKASPSEGKIADDDFNASLIAQEYEKAGARAISCLTEEDFFLGSVDIFKQVKNACSLPVLRKDFIIDEYQVYESKYINADAILLILACLTDEQLLNFKSLAHILGLYCLVETHTEEELKRACDLGFGIIGINNRDLKSFHTTIETSIKLSRFVPEQCCLVSESGIKSSDDLVKLSHCGVDAVLVGTHIMRSDDKTLAIKELLSKT